MVLFYTENIENNIAHFEGDELKHIIQSMRRKSGDTIDFVDGKGSFYSGKIIESTKKSLQVRITDSRKETPNKLKIHLAVSPTKNQDRIEWLVEKSIELGISEMSFIQCKHSEKKNIKIARIKRIAVSAMKQSLKASLPVFHELRSFEEWINDSLADHSFIASLHERTIPFVEIYDPSKSTRICIGPEGGFRDTEIDMAINSGFQAVSLGSQRLRTETAALYAVANMHVLQNIVINRNS